jgi:hypothetical protein
MTNHVPFSLNIFVADGDPDGLRLVERTNWIGKAVMFREHFLRRSGCAQSSSKRACIYYSDHAKMETATNSTSAKAILYGRVWKTTLQAKTFGRVQSSSSQGRAS